MRRRVYRARSVAGPGVSSRLRRCVAAPTLPFMFICNPTLERRLEWLRIARERFDQRGHELLAGTSRLGKDTRSRSGR
jgi:hypothetical protein